MFFILLVGDRVANTKIGAQKGSEGRKAREKKRENSQACQEEAREFFGQTQALSLIANGIISHTLVFNTTNCYTSAVFPSLAVNVLTYVCVLAKRTKNKYPNDENKLLRQFEQYGRVSPLGVTSILFVYGEAEKTRFLPNGERRDFMLIEESSDGNWCFSNLFFSLKSPPRFICPRGGARIGGLVAN